MPAATPDFAKDLYVANAARSPEGDMVTIASTSDQNFKKYLNTKEPVDGYSIASIEWSDRVGATKVTINKHGKFATLTFNQALLSQAAPPGPARSGSSFSKCAFDPPSGGRSGLACAFARSDSAQSKNSPRYRLRRIPFRHHCRMLCCYPSRMPGPQVPDALRQVLKQQELQKQQPGSGQLPP